MKIITIKIAEMEASVLTEILEQARHQNKALAQLSQTTTAERELYRQKVDVATGVIDQIR